MSRPRAICFTLNNYTVDELNNLDQIVNNVEEKNIKYICFQEERGQQGTPHIQGYCVAHNPKSLQGWKTLLGTRIHLEVARGTAKENQAYTSKESDRIEGTVWRTGGTPPESGKRNDLLGVASAISSGLSTRAIFEQYPGEYLKFNRGIQSARLLYSGKRNFKTEIFWLYGPTGTGKSRIVHEVAPEAYWKNPTTKWWCGYDEQTDVVIDDYRRDFSKFTDLLRLFDRYPLTVESKGGSISFMAKRIFVTTCHSPRKTWEDRTEEQLGQLLRRIEHVFCFAGISDPSDSVRRICRGEPVEELGEGGGGGDEEVLGRDSDSDSSRTRFRRL